MEITIEVNFYDFARRDCNGNVNAEIYATLAFMKPSFGGLIESHSIKTTRVGYITQCLFDLSH